ncbi:hypothetical protein [Mucilaginibacter lacusdianchii]|uniref:hypothetical protein n=1 Tax=Mucilaginibacter lacusdianchii TaxID=2684211 RepID=UPI00131D8417|nr:hypothetical protein [Mucilaginibacter sp. JXJ CY 39]
MFVSGEIKDQFCPIPDYWDDRVSQKEIERWKGNADTLVNYVPSVKKEAIENYLVRWDLDKEEKAYDDDEFTNCDWQLVDFMRKLSLPYPIDENENVKGQTYKLWTKDIPLVPEKTPLANSGKTTEQIKKPWWKMW